MLTPEHKTELLNILHTQPSHNGDEEDLWSTIEDVNIGASDEDEGDEDEDGLDVAFMAETYSNAGLSAAEIQAGGAALLQDQISNQTGDNLEHAAFRGVDSTYGNAPMSGKSRLLLGQPCPPATAVQLLVNANIAPSEEVY